MSEYRTYRFRGNSTDTSTDGMGLFTIPNIWSTIASTDGTRPVTCTAFNRPHKPKKKSFLTKLRNKVHQKDELLSRLSYYYNDNEYEISLSCQYWGTFIRLYRFRQDLEEPSYCLEYDGHGFLTRLLSEGLIYYGSIVSENERLFDRSILQFLHNHPEQEDNVPVYLEFRNLQPRCFKPANPA